MDPHFFLNGECMAKTREVTTDDIKLDDVAQDLSRPGIIDVESPTTADFGAVVSEEAFAHQELEVYFPEPADENDFQFVDIKVNELPRKVFKRIGQTMRLKRCEVEVLARSKIARVRTDRRVLPDGSETMEPKISYHPVYPFSVVHDPAGGRGVSWLKTIMSQPA